MYIIVTKHHKQEPFTPKTNKQNCSWMNIYAEFFLFSLFYLKLYQIYIVGWLILYLQFS